MDTLDVTVGNDSIGFCDKKIHINMDPVLNCHCAMGDF